MFRNKLWLHQIVLFGVLGLLILWSIFDRSFIFSVSLLWWLLGALVGFVFVFSDRLFNSLVAKPNEVLNVRIKDLFLQGKVTGGLKLLLEERYDQRELVMRSFLFIIVWVILAIFTMTSVTNFFARGFVLGIGIHLIFDLIYDFITDKERLDMWFWQIKRTLEPEEKRWFVVIALVIFIFLAFSL